MPPALGAKLAIIAIAQQRIVVGVRLQVNRAAMAAVAARRSAARNILLPAEGHAAISAVAAFHHNLGFVSKHGSLVRAENYREGYDRDGGKTKIHDAQASASRDVKEIQSAAAAADFFSSAAAAASSTVTTLMNLPAPAAIFKAHHAVDQREQRIVLRARHILSGLVARAALPDQDAAARNHLAAETLHAQPLAVRIAPVY